MIWSIYIYFMYVHIHVHVHIGYSNKIENLNSDSKN